MTESNSNNSNLPLASEEIVAYLDGELSPEECERVEARLSTDADFRRELQEMDRAWHALDELPQATVDDDFARTTIEMLAVAAERDLNQQTMALPRRRRRRTLLLAAICLAATTTGFAAARLLVPDTNRLLVADLPVIEQLDVLEQIDSVEFLRQLQESVGRGWWNEHRDELTPAVDRWQQVAASAPGARRELITQLDSEQQAELDVKRRRFAALDRTAQNRLRDLHAEIIAADDREQLQRTLVAYGHWVAMQTPGEQAELLELPIDERLRKIARMHREDILQHAAQQLSAEDQRALRETALDFAAAHDPEFKRRLEEDRRREPGGVVSPRLQFWGSMVAGWRASRDEAARRDFLRELHRNLSDEARQRLDSTPERMRADLLRAWFRISFQSLRQRLTAEIAGEDLERFFLNELDNDERARLLAMPREQMQRELEQAYLSEKFEVRQGAFRRSWGDRGPFGRGRREGPPRDDRRRPPPPGDELRGPPPDAPPRGPARRPGEERPNGRGLQP